MVRDLKSKYNNFYWILFVEIWTYVRHGFHWVAETVRLHFPVVDSLIATVNKEFIKAPCEEIQFKELYPNFIFCLRQLLFSGVLG